MSGPQRGTGANEGVGKSGTSRKGKRDEIKQFLMLGIKSEICREGNKWSKVGNVKLHQQSRSVDDTQAAVVGNFTREIVNAWIHEKGGVELVQHKNGISVGLRTNEMAEAAELNT